MGFLKGMLFSKLMGRRMLYGGLLFSLGRMLLNRRNMRMGGTRAHY